MKKTSAFMNRMTLYSQHKNYAELLEQVDNFVKNFSSPVQFALFTSDQNAFDYFKPEVSGKFNVTWQYQENGLLIGELSKEYRGHPEKKISGKFLLFEHDREDFYIALTDEDSFFFNNGLLKYLQIHYPVFTFPYYYTGEMERMLDFLAGSSTNSSLILNKISSRSRTESNLTWARLAYKVGFQKVRENDAWIKKIYFDLLHHNQGSIDSTILKGAMSRDGVYKCESGFKLFYDQIVKNSVDIFSKRKEKLSNRARVKETNYEGKPLFIEFEEAVFKDKSQNKRLIDILRKLSRTANSVIHDNPYLHATVVDYLDNSSYEIWVLSERRITIVPQTVCTMSSLNRLCDHISKEFHDGKLLDLKEVM